MRILDIETDKALSNICLYLTPAEAKDMMGRLKHLLENKIDHAHVDDDSYQHEVTMTIYNKENLQGYNERSKKLILEDK
jgi:hypothetical protein